MVANIHPPLGKMVTLELFDQCFLILDDFTLRVTPRLPRRGVMQNNRLILPRYSDQRAAWSDESREGTITNL